MIRRKKHHRRSLYGQPMLALGALSLLGVSVYELWTQRGDFWAWIQGVAYLTEVEESTLVDDMAIAFDSPEMMQMGPKLFFLIVTIVFGAYCLARRNRATGAWILMAVDVAVGVGAWKLGMFGFQYGGWRLLLILIPLALIMAGCITNLIHRAVLNKQAEARHRRHMEKMYGTQSKRGDERAPQKQRD